MTKASGWELEEAVEESVEMVECHSPLAFVIENGKLQGMNFEVLEYHDEGGRLKARKPAKSFPRGRHHSRHRPGKCLSLDRERSWHRT